MKLEIRKYNREAEKEVAEMFEGNGLDVSEDVVNKIRRELIQNKVASAIASIAETLNSGSQEDVVEGMLLGLRMTHRYIQSEFWQGMIQLIKRTSELDFNANFDGRNDWVKIACKRMYEAK